MTDTASPPAAAPTTGVTATKDVSPFRRAATVVKRLKLFLWGDYGVGKTRLGLQFPKVVVIDLEGGTDLYGSSFEFDVVRATTADEVMAYIDWLLSHPHPYCTLLIDPFTIYWEALQRKWSEIFLRRNKGSKGHRFEFYEFQPKDWMVIKAELKELIRKLIALDMNVIVTARQKPLYADAGFMQAIGHTFDGEKSLPYLFDTIIRLYRDPQGRFMGECLKDRSYKLPTAPFECTYDVFVNAFGADVLTRAAALPTAPTDAQRKRVRELINALGIPQNQVNAVCEEYGAAGVHELSADSMSQIIERLDVALAKKNSIQKEA